MRAGSEGRLRLTVLGAFSATVDGKPVRLPTRKAQALLAYLALGDPAGESRERMMALLWSESDTKQARDSLRQAIKEVNDALLEAGFEGFNSGQADPLARAFPGRQRRRRGDGKRNGRPRARAPARHASASPTRCSSTSRPSTRRFRSGCERGVMCCTSG